MSAFSRGKKPRRVLYVLNAGNSPGSTSSISEYSSKG